MKGKTGEAWDFREWPFTLCDSPHFLTGWRQPMSLPADNE